MTATRYHSLIVDPEDLDDEFEQTAWTVDQEEQARSLMRMGISGLFTNDPDALRSARPALVSSL